MKIMPSSNASPRTLCVLGGGSAGYLAALSLKQTLPEARITLIESTRIPVIGVGEAATPLLLHFLHHRLGIPTDQFFADAKPTLKLGVRFNWGLPGDHHFNVTFGTADFRAALHHTGQLNNLSFASMLMDHEKTPFVREPGTDRPVAVSRGYAYHVDNRNFLAFLKRELINRGIEYLDTEIAEAQPSPDGGSLARLVTKDGQTLQYDLYIDCSGFRSVLLGRALNTPWVSYASSLRTDRAVLGMASNPGEPRPYTSATTLRHGWMWNTPMQGEDHLGYVFSSAHCSDDEARRELAEYCPRVNAERVVHFTPGRREQSWRGNVVGLGNAFAFIEPLHSTGLHMILRQLRMLGKALTRDQITPEARETYNLEAATSWDRLRWFVALGFRFNHRLQTPFWNMCQQEVDLSGLTEYIHHYQQFGPLSDSPAHPLHAAMNIDPQFSSFAHDSIMVGCGVQPGRSADTVASHSNVWSKRFGLQTKLVERGLTHLDALHLLAATAIPA